MTTRIGAATGTNTVTLPAHQAGDLILLFAYRDGNTAAPTQPTGQGWTSGTTASGSTNSARLSWKIAAGSSEGVGTFTNASSCIGVVYRPTSGYALSVGTFGQGTGSSTTVTYPACALQAGHGNRSWIAGFAGHRSTNVAIETAPSGMTNVTSVSDATDEAAAHDTNAVRTTNWGATGAAVGGTSSGFAAITVEIREQPLPPTVTDDPDNASKLAGETATFTVAATGLGTVTYQWQDDSGGSFANISGETGTSYTTAALTTAANGRQVRCVVSNEGGSVNSAAATLTVGTAFYFVTYPSAEAEPTATQVKAGQRASGSPATDAGIEAARTTDGEDVFDNLTAGLAGGTSYKSSIVWTDGVDTSNVVTVGAFTTEAGATGVEVDQAGAGADTVAIAAAVPVAQAGTGTDSAAVSAAVPVAQAATASDAAAVSAAIAAADAGSGAETVAAGIGAAAVDSGAGSDAAAVLAAVPVAQAGTAADLASVTATAAVADAASGVDSAAALILVGTADAGAGSDGTPAIAAAVPLAEAGAGADAPAVSATLQASDAGAAADAVTVDATNLVPVADGAAGVESVSVTVVVGVAEGAAGLEATGITAQAAVADAGSGSDAATGTPEGAIVAVADAAAALEALSLAIVVSPVELAAGVDALAISAAMSLADSGASVDQVAAGIIVAVLQSGAATDAVAVTVQVPIADAAAGTDAIARLEAVLAVLDLAGSVDVATAITPNAGVLTITFAPRARVPVLRPGARPDVLEPISRAPTWRAPVRRR